MFQINSKVILVAVIMISDTYSSYDSDAEYGPSSPGIDIEGELHMDSVPTGYLPDSVYRELAWYGILQIQPLYYSTKHKVAARWIWQNTLGRPHVVLENSAQATESESKGSYQTLVEESAKWSREQRSAVDVLMENIRSGGNGLTVRTVISATKKSAYIIQNNKNYECGPDSEPDIDAFRSQSNMHERKCTEDKEPQLVPIDICMEAEFTQVEYSYVDGWSFCMGDGERDSTYTDSGDLDCGQKTKVKFSRFLEECAIDSNVVITFDYFGDEPRKDLIQNTTICTTWDPCRFSYLYRIEAPSEHPEVPTTTPDPCDTTVCPECLPSEETVIDEDERPITRTKYADLLEWVEMTNDEFKAYESRAFVGGECASYHLVLYVARVHYKNMTIPGKYIKYKAAYIGFNGSEIEVPDKFEIAIAKNGSNLEWVPAGPAFFDNAIPAGVGVNGYTSYLCRANVSNCMIPGRFYKESHVCYNTHFNQRKNINFEVLIHVDRPTPRQNSL